MQPPLLSIQNLAVEFKTGQQPFKALQDVSFDVKKGAVTAVVGESGSGKSVCSLSILRLLQVGQASYTGSIIFNNKEEQYNLLQVDEQTIRGLRGNDLAMIFQEPMTSLNPLFTCGNQVMEAIVLHKGLSKEKAKEETIALFQKVQLPDPAGMFNRYPHQLSGGQKQRVMIAMAMSCNPLLLIADEPTTALDVTVQKSILRLIKELQLQNEMSVIFITHDLALVAEIADEVVVMYKGRIVEKGPARQVFQNAQHPYTKALLQCRPAMHQPLERLPTVKDFMEIDADGNIIEKSFKVDELLLNEPPKTNAGDTPLVQVKDLDVWFAQKRGSWFKKATSFVKAVDGVDLEIYPGETVGLVGESGCGKTTLGRAILRLVEPTRGNIIFKGQSITALPDEELKKLRRQMQIVFQDPYSSLNPRLSIGGAIMEVMDVHQVGTNKNHRRDMVMHLLEKVQLQADHFNRYPHQFSGGQKQRIGIARTLALQPDFIIWDESVSALDVSVQAQVLNLLNDLKKEFGFASLFISHDLSVVRYISDRMLVMYKGKIVESGTAKQVYEQPREAYTQSLIAAIPAGRTI